MWMKRCVSTQTWQPVTANLTLPFGTVSWLHFSSKPWAGSAFTSLLQLFSWPGAPWSHHDGGTARRPFFKLHFTSMTWQWQAFAWNCSRKLFYGIILHSLPIDFWFFGTKRPWLSAILWMFTEWRTWSALSVFARLFHLITNIPSLVVEQQKIVHFGSGLFFTERC